MAVSRGRTGSSQPLGPSDGVSCPSHLMPSGWSIVPYREAGSRSPHAAALVIEDGGLVDVAGANEAVDIR